MTKQQAIDELKYRVSELLKANTKIEERRKPEGLSEYEIHAKADNRAEITFFKDIITLLEQ